jgi:tetratricopeptide (TPR) repeat protein
VNDTALMEFTASLRRRRRTWALALAGLLCAAAAVAAWEVHRRRIDPRAVALRAEAETALLRDDPGSLQRAAAGMAAAVSVDPRLDEARADRALALLLLADDAADEAVRAEARFRDLDGQRAQLEGGKPAGWEERLQELVGRMRVAKAELEPVRERSRRLRDEALGLLRPLARERAGEEWASRALALHYALDGEAAQVERLVPGVLARAGGRDPADPWVVLAAATAETRRRDGQGRVEVAVQALETVVAAHPRMLRARLELAAAQAALGRRDAAVAALDSVLTVNPEHERARAQKLLLLAPPPASVRTVPTTDQAPPRRRPGWLPRRPAGDPAR